MKKVVVVCLALLGAMASSAQADQRKIDVVISNHHTAERQIRIWGERNFSKNNCFDSKTTHGVLRVDGKKGNTPGRATWTLYFKPPTRDLNGYKQCTDENCLGVCVQLCDQKGSCYSGGGIESSQDPHLCASYDAAKNGSMIVIDSRGRGFDQKNSKGWISSDFDRSDESCGG